MNLITKAISSTAVTVFLMTNIFAVELSEPRKKVILWDLSYVLLRPNHTKMYTYVLPKACGINPWNIVRLGMLYNYGCLSSQNLQDTMDAVLHHARSKEQPQTVIVNQYGKPHSNIDCDHLSGARSGKELFAEIQESIAKLDLADKNKTSFEDLFFKNPAHKYLVEQIFELLYLDPKSFGESFTLIAPGVELLQRCAKAGYEIAILSNWGIESFPHMLAYEPNNLIFQHIKPENIFVSGKIKALKPYPQAYEYVISKMRVAPEDIIFIDDQIKNVEAARTVGMQAIHLTDYKNPEAYKMVEQELKRLVALS